MSLSVVPRETTSNPLAFQLPPELEAGAPAEARGLARDGVRLLASYGSAGVARHGMFRDLPTLLASGDLLVINTSGTLAAAVAAERADGTALTVHLSTQLPGGLWAVEVRLPAGSTTQPFRHAAAGERLALAGSGVCTLIQRYRSGIHPPSTRLWLATLDLPSPVLSYLEAHGNPIRYPYAREPWPLSAYQTGVCDGAGERGNAFGRTRIHS